MQYLVTMEFVEAGPLLSAQQLGQMVEQTILPSFELLAGLQAEGKIVAGGVLAGTRTASFIVEAASNDELDQIVEGLPFWAVMKTGVVPLQDFGQRAANDRALLERIKSSAQ
jgi:muconolactone delta-isomerase